jgi:hypothetical protein
MKRAAFCLALAISSIAPAGEARPSLAWMHGEWTGTGIFSGRPASFALSFAPALEGKATALAYTVVAPESEGRPEVRFDGRAIWHLDARGRVNGRWDDSAGNSHPVGGRVAADRMTTVWGEATTEIGRSTYFRNADGTLAVSDSVRRADGSWSVFASASYRRRP